MEKLKSLSRLVLVTAMVGGAGQACRSNESDSSLYISSCSTVRSYSIDYPSFAATPQSAQASVKDDVAKVKVETSSQGPTIKLDSSLFLGNVPSPQEAPDRPTRELTDGSFQVAAELPADLKSFLAEQSKNVDPFLPVGRKIVAVNLYKKTQGFGDNFLLGGRPAKNAQGENIIEIDVTPDTEIDRNELSMAVFHEGMHVDFKEIGPGQSFGWVGESDEIWKLLDSRRYQAQDAALGKLEKKGYVVNDFNHKFVDGKIKLLGDLFNIVTESCYRGEGGHPDGNPDEMFASTATVMKFFPRSYLATLDRLSGKDKTTMETLSKYVLGTLFDNAPDRQEAMKQFDSRLLARFGY